MKKTNPTQLGKELSARLWVSMPRHTLRLFLHLLRLLADGKPVPLGRLAAGAQATMDIATAAVRGLPNVEFDDEGNVVGAGLTLSETPYRFEVNGRLLYTWCALDTLIFPSVIGKSAHVRSHCPVTKEVIELVVTPNEFGHVEPSGTVMSVVLPDASSVCCNIRGAFCDHVSFFSSRQAAREWPGVSHEAIILSVKDAFVLGQLLAESLELAASWNARVTHQMKRAKI